MINREEILHEFENGLTIEEISLKFNLDLNDYFIGRQ